MVSQYQPGMVSGRGMLYPPCSSTFSLMLSYGLKKFNETSQAGPNLPHEFVSMQMTVPFLVPMPQRYNTRWMQ